MQVQKGLKWGAFIVAGVALLLITVSIVGYGVFLLPPVQKTVLKRAEHELNKLLVGSITIGAVRTNLISQVDLHDIVIHDTTGREDSVRVDHVHITYRLLPLLQRRVAIPVVTITGVHASLSVQPDGTMILPMLPKPQPKKEPVAPSGWTGSVDKVAINNINGHYNDSARQQRGIIIGAAVTARIPAFDSILVTLQVSDGEYTSPWWRGAVEQITAAATIHSDRIVVSKVLFRGEGTRVIGGGSIPFTEDGAWDLRAVVQTPMSPVPAVHANVPGLALQGFLKAKASWHGTMKQPIMHVDAFAYSVDYKGVKVDTLNVIAAYDALGQITSTIAVAAAAANLAVTVSGAMPDLLSRPVIGAYQVAVLAKNVIPEKFAPLGFSLPPLLEGMIAQVRTNVTGIGVSVLPAHVTVTGTATGLPLGGKPLDFSASLTGADWHTAVTWGENQVAGSGHLFPKKQRFDGELQGTIGEIAAVTQFMQQELSFPVAGSISAQVVCGGTFSNPQVVATVAGDSLSGYGARIDTLGATITVDGKTMLLKRAYLAATCNVDTLAAQFSFDSAGGQVTIVAEAAGPLTAPKVAATVRGERCFFKGQHLDSLEMQVTFLQLDTILWSKLSVWEQTTEVASTGKFSLKNRRLSSSLLFSTFGEQGWTPAGTCSVVTGLSNRGDSLLATELTLTRFSLATLQPWVQQKEYYRGLVSVYGSASGCLRNPMVELSLRVDSIAYGAYRLSSFTSVLSLHDSLLSATADLRLNPAIVPVHFSAKLPLCPASHWGIDTLGTRPGSLTVQAATMKLNRLSSHFKQLDGIDGRMSVDIAAALSNHAVALSGGLTFGQGKYLPDSGQVALANLQGGVALSGTLVDPRATFLFFLDTVKLSGEQVEHILLSGRASRTAIDIDTARFLVVDSGLILLQGHIPLGSPDSILADPLLQMAFSIVHFPLRAFSSFVPENMLQKGTLQGDGKVSFEGGKPSIVGSLHLCDVTIATPDIEPAITNVNADISMTGDSIKLKNLAGSWGKGTIAGSGSARWGTTGVSDVLFQLGVRDVEADFPEVMHIGVEKADLKLTSTNMGRYLVKGSVKLGPSQFIQDIHPADFLKNLQPKPVGVSGPNPLLQKIKLAVVLDLQDNLTIDMNLGYIKLDGELSIAGTAAQPVFLGEIAIVEGYVLYLDRQFTISTGTFYNTNPYRINPLINLEAQSDIVSMSGVDMETYTIVMQLQGNLVKPVLVLKDNAGTLSEVDIISIMTFGQPLGGMGGDVKNRVKEFIGQSLLGFGTRKLEKFLGVERIDVQGDLFSNSSVANGPRVSIAKRVTPRLMVLYETEIGNLNRPKISALYRIANSIFLSGEGSETNSGIDIIFKYSK